MSEAQDKVMAIFQGLVGTRAEQLSGGKFPSDADFRIIAALAGSKEEALRQDMISFHLLDWNAEAAFIVAVCLYPERFTDQEIREGVESFLIHAPSHVIEAARLANAPITNFADDEKEKF